MRQTGFGKRVLVVDDHAMARELIVRMLADGGYDVLTASSGMEAIETLVHTHATVDLVVSDHSMPGMTGIELADHIRGSYPAIPVAIVSGDVSEIEGTISGRHDITFIKKPFHADVLYEALRVAMSRHKAARV